MIEFYIWPTNARLFITFFFAACVLFQAVSFVLSRYRYPKTNLHTYGSILELTILLQILCLSLLYGQVYMGFDHGSVAPTGYSAVRIIVFGCVAVLAVLTFVKSRKVWPLLTIASALVTLPVMEAALGKAYPYLYLLSLAFLLFRSVHLGLLRYREIKTGLSAFSVKEAIDNLQAGILFYREDGRILLESRRMQELMIRITGEAQRNGVLFYQRLTSGAYDDACKRAELDDQAVCLLPDQTAWMFTKTDIKIKGRPYVQLTASDVTQHYRLTAELKAQDMALNRRSEELKQTIANLQDLSRERELGKAKIRVHDVLGQRLTVLLRMVRGDQELDVHLLKRMSKGLLHELSVGPDSPSPGDELNNLKQIFGSIGVEVQFDGKLPERDAQARLFVDVIRESIVNAVRHGFATEVHIHSFCEDDLWYLQIRNNGHPATLPIAEGGGIGAMREKLIPNGGTLQVTGEPQFALSIILPGGEL